MKSSNKKYILKGGQVFFETGFSKVDIAISEGKIIQISKNLILDDFTIIDCKNKIICPGFIDVHVHLRTPGFEEKEDIYTGTKSAIAGGFTTIFSMPNTNPCLDNYEEIKKFMCNVESKSYCEVKTYSAISKNLKGEELVDISNISKLDISGFTDDGKGVQNENIMKFAMKKINKTQKIMAIHAEDELELKPMGYINEGIVSKKFSILGINNKSEYNIVKRDINLVREIDCKYHLCHISTKESLELIKKAKNENLDVSCEVTPHHLVLNELDIENNLINDKHLDSNYKMNPPLRSIEDQKSLIDGLNEGIISIIATDHAPHTIEEKSLKIEYAPFGIIGLETAYSVLNTFLVKNNKSKIEIILNCLTYNPAKRFNLNRNIDILEDVNLCVLNPSKEVKYTVDNTFSKSSNTPFFNKKLYGKVEYTLIKNKIYDWTKNE